MSTFGTPRTPKGRRGACAVQRGGDSVVSHVLTEVSDNCTTLVCEVLVLLLLLLLLCVCVCVRERERERECMCGVFVCE